MRRTIGLYSVALIPLVGILIPLNLAYEEFDTYSQLTDRHNLEHSQFQQLAMQINNAAIINPDFNNSGVYRRLFLTDSATIIHQLDQLKATVQDTANIAIVHQLDPLVRSEVKWLLESSVPDSIMQNRATAHLVKYQQMVSLIQRGIARTKYLLQFRMVQLKKEIYRVKVWTLCFISLTGLLFFISTVNLIRELLRRKSKEKEIAQYKYALEESSIVAITNQKGIIIDVNNNFCKISKYSREELLGQDHRIINSGYHPKEFIRDLWVTIANGNIWKGELKNKAKDGTIYWVDTTIVPFLNEKGKPYQYLAIRADITERKLAEEKLIQNEKIYRTIASSIPGSVLCLLDKEFRYILIEGDMIEKLGYSKQLLLGNKAVDILSAEVFEGVKNDLNKTLNGQYVLRESNIAGYDIISRFIPLKDESNEVYAILTVAIDISELKAAQRNVIELNRDLEEKIHQRTEQLEKSNQEMEAFSYSVSHDLRAPLRGIVGFSSILEEDYSNALDDEGKRILNVIRSNTMKMGNLIDDLLAFSRMGKQELRKTVIDIQSMVLEVVKEMQPSEKIKWKIHSLRPVTADFNTLRQVWVNLISNAIKYSALRSSPEIEIGSYHENGFEFFYIKDNGVGFNTKYKHKLFKVFQRLHSAASFEGTGVGLAIVDKIIARHGGKVWAESEEEKGAVFYFSLPDETAV